MIAGGFPRLHYPDFLSSIWHLVVRNQVFVPILFLNSRLFMTECWMEQIVGVGFEAVMPCHAMPGWVEVVST